MAKYKYDPTKNQTLYYNDDGELYKAAKGDTTATNGVVPHKGYVKPPSDTVTITDGTRTLRVTPDMADRYYSKGWSNGTGNSTSTGSANYAGNQGMITDQYDQQRKSLIAQLKASIAKAKGGYSDIITKAPQTYQPLRNQNEVSKESKLASMREALANQGNAGGTGRQELLGINALAENKKNEIDLQQQNVISDANSAISSLDEQAAFKESEITADMASQKLQALLAENARVDELNREQGRYSKEYSDKIAQQEKDNQYKDKVYNDNLAEQQLEREINSIGAYSNDFMAEIKRRETLPANDPGRRLIPFLYAERNQKIAKQLAEQDNSASQVYKNAYDKWLQLGTATAEIAQILNIPTGSKTVAKLESERKSAPSSGGGSGGGGIPGVPSQFTD
jgi:hypothetical protein